MPSTFPAAPDDLGRDGLTHGDVTDALAAVETAVSGLLAGTGGRLLSGTTAPLSGSGLLPLDGVNDPWRWFQYMTGWVGPTYRVTWKAGDKVGFFPPLPETNEEYALWVGSVTTPTEANDNPGDFYSSATSVHDTDPPGAPTTTTTSNIYVAQSNGVPGLGRTSTNGPGIAVADGSGIAFLFQAERGWTGPTAVPDPTFTDLAAVLGPDVIIGAPFIFNEAGDGNDGDFWLDKSTTTLYGPKAGGVWPAGVIIKGFDTGVAHFLRGGLYLQSTQNPGEPALTLTDIGPPDPAGYLDAGSVAVWYDATAGAPSIRFTGKDSDGAVYTASLPMTPA